jgi:uncharacterized delta-60 repeat protein
MRTLLAVPMLLLGAVAHAALPGELDPTFNNGQPVFLNPALTVPRVTAVQGAAHDEAGGIVVTGVTTDANGMSGLFIARIAPGGAPDASFGADDGATVLQLGLGTSQPSAPFSGGMSVGRRPGGPGWLVGGFGTAANADPAKFNGIVAAFDANGMLDPSYATGGVARPQVTVDTDQINPGSSTVGPDGTVYIAGGYLIQGRTDYIYALVIAVTPAGALGYKYVENLDLIGPAYTSHAGRPLVMPTELIVPGTTGGIVGNILAVQHVDGPGQGGLQYRAALPGNPDARGVAAALGPDGRLFVVGTARDPNNSIAMIVACLESIDGGALCGNFGTEGTSRVQAELEAGGGSSATDMVVQPDGRIVVVGTASNYADSERQIIVLRLDTSGNLDPSFGTNGIVRLKLGSRDGALAAVLSPDAKSVVVTGSSREGSITRGAVARVLLEPLTTTTTSTTTTLPPGCGAGPSLDGARCRVVRLAGAVDAATPPGKLEKKLLRCTTGADAQLSAAASATGRAQRRKLKKALKQLRKLAQRLESKAATRDIAAETRAVLAADAGALASEVEALAASVP